MKRINKAKRTGGEILRTIELFDKVRRFYDLIYVASIFIIFFTT